MKSSSVGIDEIIEIFKTEFKPIIDKFEIIKVLNGKSFTRKNVLDAKHDFIYYPGVYVFYGDNKTWKVGRHLTNSRMRTMQHIDANTRNKDYNIKELEKVSDAEIILFNVKKIEDNHWVAAVEIFLERKLNPKIPSERTG
ncbi:MAG: hypothetical protein GXO79_02285 [Chlorobi bacterium]|nr:hypothetical protein [Chlorobiota bacterium]